VSKAAGIEFGAAMLLYGPPGNGKTSFAHSLSSVFSDVIYVPYAITIEGQSSAFTTPAVHLGVSPTAMADDGMLSFVRAEEYDARWVPCRRPFVATGGELTLEMLELALRPRGPLLRSAPAHEGAGRLFRDRRLRPPTGEAPQACSTLDRAAGKPRRLSEAAYRQRASASPSRNW